MKGTKLNGTRYAPGHMSKSRQAQIGEEAHSERGTTLGNGAWRPENCQAAGRHNEAYPGIRIEIQTPKLQMFPVHKQEKHHSIAISQEIP